MNLSKNKNKQDVQRPETPSLDRRKNAADVTALCYFNFNFDIRFVLTTTFLSLQSNIVGTEEQKRVLYKYHFTKRI